MKAFLKNNSYILILYLLLLITSVSFLASYEKVAIHYYLNQFVGNKFLNLFFYYITYLGDGRVATFILLLILLYNIRLGIYVAASFLTATLFSIAMKHFFFDDVNRPSYIFKNFDGRKLTLVEGVDMYIHNSFPSGHATQAFSILMCLVFVTKNPAFKLLFFALAFLTAISRVYLSQHWLADITAGSCIGVFFSILYYFIFIQANKLEKLNKGLLTHKIR